MPATTTEDGDDEEQGEPEQKPTAPVSKGAVRILQLGGMNSMAYLRSMYAPLLPGNLGVEVLVNDWPERGREDDRHPQAFTLRCSEDNLAALGEAGTGRDLLGVFSERRPATPRLGAAPPFLNPLHAHVAVEGDVFEPLSGALVDSGAQHSTVRARSLPGGRLDHDMSLSVGVASDSRNVILGKVEQYRRCPRARLGHRLGHARGPDLLDAW